ncbi:hypothetical protein, partial [Aeromonas enteropelogenes]|uniref:hypothetical protein n=1 Tax=Aeromonas enteropelogenes TaxID=29489 RepID=UPI003BA3DAC5
GVHREDRLSHPGRTDAVNPVLVNRYMSSWEYFLTWIMSANIAREQELAQVVLKITVVLIALKRV